MAIIRNLMGANPIYSAKDRPWTKTKRDKNEKKIADSELVKIARKGEPLAVKEILQRERDALGTKQFIAEIKKAFFVAPATEEGLRIRRALYDALPEKSQKSRQKMVDITCYVLAKHGSTRAIIQLLQAFKPNLYAKEEVTVGMLRNEHTDPNRTNLPNLEAYILRKRGYVYQANAAEATLYISAQDYAFIAGHQGLAEYLRFYQLYRQLDPNSALASVLKICEDAVTLPYKSEQPSIEDEHKQSSMESARKYIWNFYYFGYLVNQYQQRLHSYQPTKEVNENSKVEISKGIESICREITSHQIVIETAIEELKSLIASEIKEPEAAHKQYGKTACLRTHSGLFRVVNPVLDKVEQEACPFERMYLR